MATTNQLEICDEPVQKYLESSEAAYDYLEVAMLA